MHPIVELARKAVEACVKNEVAPKMPSEHKGLLKERAGVFVCLKKNGELRGCIGTIQPTTACIAEEVIRNAVCAATEDRRFVPVSEEELEYIEYLVDVLMPAEKVDDPCELDPRKYGVIVTKGMRRGLLLPDLEGVDTIEEQLRIAMLKAGISPTEKDVIVERFEVKRYK